MSGKKSSKCQTCFNFDCDWHEYFKPVEGWSATPTIIKDVGQDRQIDSYMVHDCPLYKPREQEGSTRRVTIDDMAKDMGVHKNNIRYWLNTCDSIPIKNFYKSKGYRFVCEKIYERQQFYLIPMRGEQ